MNYVEQLEQQIALWPDVSVHPHRFAGREFRFHHAEVGHVHAGGTVDIPFPRAVRDALLAEGLAQEHRWVPDSGWITFHIHSEKDLGHAVWLMRLSYLRYALKRATEPQKLLEQESKKLRLGRKFMTLLEQLVPPTATRVSNEALSAWKVPC